MRFNESRSKVCFIAQRSEFRCVVLMSQLSRDSQVGFYNEGACPTDRQTDRDRRAHTLHLGSLYVPPASLHHHQQQTE